jgi:uracil-DNA glycosylase
MLKIPPSWSTPELAELLETPRAFVEQEMKRHKTIYPAPSQLLSALELTSLEDVRVVILGQDPYHGEGEAHGLAFSVNEGIKIPPSLVNIFKERETDLRLPPPSHGSLVAWAQQGVLLLNTVLSVEKDHAGSHQKKGWEPFTDQIIRMVNQKSEAVVFILWGLPAQKKVSLIDASKHLILTSPHPSPLSSYRGFFGSKPFSQTNKFLKKQGLPEIIW